MLPDGDLEKLAKIVNPCFLCLSDLKALGMGEVFFKENDASNYLQVPLLLLIPDTYRLAVGADKLEQIIRKYVALNSRVSLI